MKKEVDALIIELLKDIHIRDRERAREIVSCVTDAQDGAGRPALSWSFSYKSLSDISGKSMDAIRRSRSRPGGFDPEDFVSVVAWCIRNASPELKVYFITNAINHGVEEPPK